MTENPYDVLVQRLGYPGSTSLRSVLEELMSSDQARIAVELPGMPQEVAERTGIEPQRVTEALAMKVVRPPEHIPAVPS